MPRTSSRWMRRKATADMASFPAGEQEKIFRARAERNRTLARIRTEDWDGIILSHDMFQRLLLHPETVASYVQEEMDSLTRTIQAAKGTEKLDTRTLSSLEHKGAADSQQ